MHPRRSRVAPEARRSRDLFGSRVWQTLGMATSSTGRRDSRHHHLLEAMSGTANVLALRQRLLYTTPSGWWWWCIESLFRSMSCFHQSREACRHPPAFRLPTKVAAIASLRHYPLCAWHLGHYEHVHYY